MRALLDNNLPLALARALNCLSRDREQVSVHHLTDRFPPETPDAEWISSLATEGGWFIVSQDGFGKGRLEQQAIAQSGLHVFVLKKAWSNQPFWPTAYNLVRWWPVLLDQGRRTSPAVYEVPWQLSGSGKLTQRT